MKITTINRQSPKLAIIALCMSVLVLATASTRHDVLAGPAAPGASTLASVPNQVQGKQGGQTQPDAAVGSGFSYQGQLKDGGNPANGPYDFTFKLYDASSGGTQVGSTLTMLNQTVTGGLFSVVLDFGATAYQGQGRWMEIAVRVAGGPSYTTLVPRQALTVAPYAASLMPGAVITGTAGAAVLTVSSTSSVDGLQGRSVDGIGVYGSSSGASHTGVLGNSTGSNGTGVSGSAYIGTGAVGVRGTSADGDGVYGNSSTGYGVYGFSSSNWGVVGSGASGVWGEASAQNGTGVSASSPAGNGVAGSTGGGATVAGVNGVSGGSNGTGVRGTANSGTIATGVWGSSASGYGVYGDSSTGYGVQGISTSNWGIKGRGTSGVWGDAGASNGTGVSGSTTGGYGIHGSATTGYAGWFDGNVRITGGCCAAGMGTYKIDHPGDPQGKYLVQAAVQSPDMKSVYDGNVILDGKGEAVVELPDYVEALNRDFRYQFAPIGSSMPGLYVAEKVKHNRFKIAGGKPGGEVSWQVTGIRHDPYAQAHPVQVEVEKTADEKGKYLHPTEYGQPESQGINYPKLQQPEQTSPDKTLPTQQEQPKK